jgi:hypothetical protein
MAFDIEQDWDLLYMEVSTDQGSTWDVLGSANDPNWYNSSRFPSNQNCFNCVGAQWTGTSTTMSTYEKSLDAFSTETNVIFRFAFVTDQSVTREGAVIDNLVVTGALSNDTASAENLLSVYPNPSQGIFNLTWRGSEAMNLSVFDLSGKLILEQKDVDNSIQKIDLSQVAAGVYFLKVNSPQGSTTKKLLVQ